MALYDHNAYIVHKSKLTILRTLSKLVHGKRTILRKIIATLVLNVGNFYFYIN